MSHGRQGFGIYGFGTNALAALQTGRAEITMEILRKRIGKAHIVLLLALAMTAIITANATAGMVTTEYSGSIVYQTDKVAFDIVLTEALTDVKIWTDSYLDGVNFDPIISLWSKTSTGATLLGEDDDTYYPEYFTGQTDGDAGLMFPYLAAGKYMIYVAVYDNFAVSENWLDGFMLDGDTPVKISDWTGVATNGYCHVNFSGNAVPIPGAAVLLAPALTAIFGLRRKFLA